MATAKVQVGAALVVGLLIFTVLSVLAVAGTTSAILEIQMAANAQYSTQAFYAAEAGIAQALAAGGFSTDPSSSASRFDDLSALDPLPVPGFGTAIAHCPQPSNGADRCEYFVRFDASASPSPVPGHQGPGTGALAYHFVIESVGVAGRGARVALSQGFYIVALPGTPSSCVIGSPTCGIQPAGPPVLTFWRQRGVN